MYVKFLNKLFETRPDHPMSTRGFSKKLNKYLTYLVIANWIIDFSNIDLLKNPSDYIFL